MSEQSQTLESVVGGRDIFVIGASTGGVAALQRIIGQLPPELPAAVFAVLHQPTDARTQLARLLAKGSALPVLDAVHGDRIKLGHVYIAPPDNHVLLRDGYLAVLRGPRENGHRPAVNPLFRSAAQVYGSRVIAVVLTGALDCGSTGLRVVKARGGIGIAQNPSTSVCGEMPESAIRTGAVDHILDLDEVAPLLVRLSRERTVVPVTLPDDHPLPYSFVTCPHCHGSLTERTGAGTIEFACHVGHTFSLRTLYAEQADQVEGALWAAMRALEESISLAQRLASTYSGSLQNRFKEKEQAMRHHADTLREMIVTGNLIGRTDVAGDAGG